MSLETVFSVLYILAWLFFDLHVLVVLDNQTSTMPYVLPRP